MLSILTGEINVLKCIVSLTTRFRLPIADVVDIIHTDPDLTEFMLSKAYTHSLKNSNLTISYDEFTNLFYISGKDTFHKKDVIKEVGRGRWDSVGKRWIVKPGVIKELLKSMHLYTFTERSEWSNMSKRRRRFLETGYGICSLKSVLYPSDKRSICKFKKFIRSERIVDGKSLCLCKDTVDKNGHVIVCRRCQNLCCEDAELGVNINYPFSYRCAIHTNGRIIVRGSCD